MAKRQVFNEYMENVLSADVGMDFQEIVKIGKEAGVQTLEDLVDLIENELEEDLPDEDDLDILLGMILGDEEEDEFDGLSDEELFGEEKGSVCETCGQKKGKEMVSEDSEPGEGRPLFDVIRDLAGALEQYYEYSEEQAEDPEEFEDVGEAIGMIRKSFAMFQSKVEDADKIIQSIIGKGVE